MLFTIGLIAASIGLLYAYLVWNFNYWSNRGVLGPAARFVAGSFPLAFLQRQNIVYEADEAYREYRGKTPFIGYYESRKPVLMLLDPEYVKSALITNFKHFHDNDIFFPKVDKVSDPLLGRNPFMLTGDEWKEKRGEITPAFTNTKLKTMYPIMQHVAKKLTAHINNAIEASTNTLDIKEVAARFTIDVVSNCIYGIDAGALANEQSEIYEMGNSMFDFSTKRQIYMAICSAFPFVSSFCNMPFIPKRVETFFCQLNRDAMRLRQESSVQRDDFLNFLLQLHKRKPMPNIDMTAHTMTFFLDGFETSSLVISNVLLQLAQNAEVLTRLRAEIAEAVASAEHELTFEQINEMEYLDRVIHESLRISPVIWGLTKMCTESIALKDYAGREVLIEKGTTLQIPTYSIQRDAENYGQPDTFDPDRFAADRGGLKKYRDAGVFLGFGDGPRICLGMRFGLMQVKVAVAEILRNFSVDVAAKMQLPVVYEPNHILLVPRGGFWLDLKPLKKAN